ncbi:hypothetical protein LX36DRAFT_654981 [Colletotrichum falcatum]|nr:hypothetical protein LX36DRAFT_654981 [Colletotrichum falcatum]
MTRHLAWKMMWCGLLGMFRTVLQWLIARFAKETSRWNCDDKHTRCTPSYEETSTYCVQRRPRLLSLSWRPHDTPKHRPPPPWVARGHHFAMSLPGSSGFQVFRACGV